MTDTTPTALAKAPATVAALVGRPVWRGLLSAYRDWRTYARLVHLLADLVLGTVYFTVLMTLLATSAALVVTLLGVPLLFLTLLAARGIAHLERARARALLGVDVAAPEQARTGLWRRLLDGADWRATLYGLAMLPVGVVTGIIALSACTTTAAALAYPLYAPTLADPALRLGGLALTGFAGDVTALAVGVVLLVVLPRLLELLARIDTALEKALLR